MSRERGYPGPSRSLAHPWGLPVLGRQEFEKVVGDDVLLYRMILLYVVAQLARDAQLGTAKPLDRKELVKKRRVGLWCGTARQPGGAS